MTPSDKRFHAAVAAMAALAEREEIECTINRSFSEEIAVRAVSFADELIAELERTAVAVSPADEEKKCKHYGSLLPSYAGVVQCTVCGKVWQE